MRRYPLLLVTTLFASGVIAGGTLAVGYKVWLGSAMACATLAWLSPSVRLFFVWSLVPLCGAALFACHMQVISPIDLRLILGGEPELISAKGLLIETPAYTRYEQRGRERFRTSCRMRVAELSVDKKPPQAANGWILVTMPGRLPDGFFQGQEVTIDGVIGPPPNALAEGLFDYRKYLAGQRIYFQLQTRQTNDWKLTDRVVQTARPWADRFLTWGRRVTALGLPAEDSELYLLWAMSLGWRPGLNTDASVPFIRTGTMHIFAISGLHVALIAAILVQVFRFIRIPREVCAWAIIPLIWFYTGATGWQPSAIRSTIMSSIVVFGWSLKRPSNLLNSLMASALIILVWQPEQLSQASFQLSFFVVLSMALLLPAREKPGALNENPGERLARNRWLNWIGSHPLTWRKQGWKPGPFVGWWPGDELLPPQLEPSWLRGFRHASQFVLISLLTSVAAWIGSLPLIMYYFSIITPISLLANLLVVPLSSMALTCNLASLCTGEWLSGATTLFNHAAWFFMFLMDKLSAAFSAWRPGYFYTRAPTVSAILCYYVFVVLVAAGYWHRSKLRYLTWGALATGLCIYFFPVLKYRDSLRMTVLPAGGGSILIDDHSRGERLLVDASDERGAKMILTPFLHSLGINALDFLFLTHASIRHVGGIGVLLNDTPPKKAVASGLRFRSIPYNTAVRELERNRIPLSLTGENDTVGRWRVLHPAKDAKPGTADSNPLVFKGEHGGLRLLFLSDLGLEGQKELIARHSEELKTDLLIAGMPARGEPLDSELLETAAPKIIILCTSDYPASNRGSRKLRARLESHGIPIFYCDEAKAITVTVKPNLFRLEPVNGESLEWKSGQAPKLSRRNESASRLIAPSEDADADE